MDERQKKWLDATLFLGGLYRELNVNTEPYPTSDGRFGSVGDRALVRTYMEAYHRGTGVDGIKKHIGSLPESRRDFIIQSIRAQDGEY